MADTRDLGNKIRALANMQKVMHAMNMIATVKLGKLMRLRDPLERFRNSVKSVTDDIRALGTPHPVISGFGAVSRALVVLVSADKGLCGSHNTSVQRAAASLADRLRAGGAGVEFTCIGLKGSLWCARNGFPVVGREEINERTLSREKLRELANAVFERFESGAVQQVYLVFDRFVTTIHQEAESSRLLPVADSPDGAEAPRRPTNAPGKTGRDDSGRVAAEPDLADFASGAGLLLLYYAVNAAVLESRLSEQAARMTAMENATRNAEDLIGRYSLLRNRTRQNAITNEITEIVSGMQSME